MENCQIQFSDNNIDFERIDAVNGWQLSQHQIDSVYDVKRNRKIGKYPLVLPEIGCYLSHYQAWKKIANGEDEGGFIFEDDFITNSDLKDVLELLSQDIQDWDMIKLFTLNPKQKKIFSRPLSEKYNIIIPYKVPSCLLGYGLRREAAKKLIKQYQTISRPVDEDIKFFWETGLRVALVDPMPLKIGDQQTVTGTIGNERRIKSKEYILRSKSSQALHGILYQLKYTILLHWYRIIK
ncbi:Glycosyl transferase, family 25 [uncultured Candidatus Thioglobus sp.]|nr:Glycosyl transferase, family 25 [uncultured Candidatus Thioglobus sp.]